MTGLDDSSTIHFFKDKDLYGLGNNYYGTIGSRIVSSTGNSLSRIDTPVAVADPVKFDFVHTSENLGAAVDVSGNVWTWGNLNDGTLGRLNASSADRRIAGPITYQPEPMTKVMCTARSIVMLGVSGKLYGIGRNMSNVFGLTEQFLNHTFTSLKPIFEEHIVEDFWHSHNNTYIIDKDGVIWGAGSTGAYGLGLYEGAKKNLNALEIARISQPGDRFKIVKASESSLFALREDGVLAALGSAGQVMLDTVTNKTYKTLTLSEDENRIFKDFWINKGRFFGLKEDGTLWVDGVDSSILEGLNGGSKRDKLTQIGTSLWDQLSPRAGGMYGLQKDGTLWTWGQSHDCLNFQDDIVTTYFAPQQIAIEGITKLKGNANELHVDQVKQNYKEHMIEFTLRNKGNNLLPVHEGAPVGAEIRYLFKEHGAESANYLRFEGGKFQGVRTNSTDGYNIGHTAEELESMSGEVMEHLFTRVRRRLYIVSFTRHTSSLNGYFFTELRQEIEEADTISGMPHTSRIFLPGFTKNIVNKEILEDA